MPSDLPESYKLWGGGADEAPDVRDGRVSATRHGEAKDKRPETIRGGATPVFKVRSRYVA